MIQEFVTDSAQAIEAARGPFVTNVWIHGSVTFVTTEVPTEVDALVKPKRASKKAEVTE